MLSCSFLAVCERVIEDADTHTWTIVALVEQASFEKFGVVVPWCIISYWDLDATETAMRRYMVRVVLVAPDGSRAFEGPGFQVNFAAGRRARINLRGFHLPPGAGDFDVRMEWTVGSRGEWTDAGHRWPLRLAQSAPPPAPPSEPSKARH